MWHHYLGALLWICDWIPLCERSGVLKEPEHSFNGNHNKIELGLTPTCPHWAITHQHQALAVSRCAKRKKVGTAKWDRVMGQMTWALNTLLPKCGPAGRCQFIKPHVGLERVWALQIDSNWITAWPLLVFVTLSKVLVFPELQIFYL